MPDNHIHLPPMPKPEDFGITAVTWVAYANEFSSGHDAAVAIVEAYNRAIEAWTRVAESK